MKRLHLWVAVAILASGSAVVRKLAEIGAANPIDGRNPISFCNVLFAGNVVALALILVGHRREWSRANLAKVARDEWVSMLGVAMLSVALAPALIFTALERTSVTSVVLLGRIEPPLVLALGALVLGDRLSRWGVIGALTVLAGVAASLLLQPMMDGLTFGRGEAFALMGAACLAVGTVLAKARLGKVPLGIFAGTRMVVGTVVFAIVVLTLFGPAHFVDIFAPQLWAWMLLYGGIVVTGGQLFWFSGLRSSSTLQVSIASSVSPVVAVLAAFAILGEVPMLAQLIGGAIMLSGIGMGLWSSTRPEATVGVPAGGSADHDRNGGFKGV